MFEIFGNDISSLGDTDLRYLVTRLATAELTAKGYPLSSVTAGGIKTRQTADSMFGSNAQQRSLILISCRAD